MSVRERVLALRLAEKLRRSRGYGEAIGVSVVIHTPEENITKQEGEQAWIESGKF